MSASMWVVMAAAVLASLAIGILAAHGVCMLMFRVFRIHARQMQSAQQSAKKVAVASQFAGVSPLK